MAALSGMVLSSFPSRCGTPSSADPSAELPRAVPTPSAPGIRWTGDSAADFLAKADAGNSPDRIWAAVERALRIPDSELPKAPELILQISDADARRWLARGLYSRWAESDAPAALASADTLPQGLDFTAREIVLRVMAQRDPAGTLALTKEMTPGGRAGNLGPECPVLAEWARTSPQAALAYVLDAQRAMGEGAFDDQPTREAFRQQTYTVLAVWLEYDPAAVTAWFRSLPDGMERRFIARRLDLAGQRFAPELPAALAAEFPGSGLGRRAGYYPVAAALDDPQRALTMLPANLWTWETGLVFADMGGSGMRAPVPVEQVQAAARALLERLPEGPAADGVRCGAAMRAGLWSEAAEAASRFPESGERAAVWGQIATEWTRTDRAAADAWLAARPAGFSREHALAVRESP